jgi:hypothetical protein
MANRRQSWKTKDRATMQLLQNMAQWAAAPSSSLHIVKAGVRAETKTKDLAAVVISLLLTTKHKTIWYLSSNNVPESPASIMKALVFQACRQASCLNLDARLSLSVGNLQAEHTETEWLDILCHILKKLSGQKCFVVVEMAIPYPRLPHLFQLLVDSLSNVQVKILIILSSVSALNMFATGSALSITSFVQQPPPVAIRKRSPAYSRGRNPADILQQILAG